MQSSEREELKDSHLTSDQVKEFYEKETAQLPDKVPLEDLLQLSRRVSDEVQEYRHCDYQAAIAAIALSLRRNPLWWSSPPLPPARLGSKVSLLSTFVSRA